MRKHFCFLLAILLVLVSFTCCAEGRKTPFDRYSEWKTVETITSPVFPQTKNAEELRGNDAEIVNFLGRAWYNMLAYETDVLGKAMNSTLAASIYKGIKKGPGVSIFTACDPDALLLNAFFACNGNYGATIIWLEWDLEAQTIRFFDQMTENKKNDNAFLSDYVLNSYLAASMDGNVIGIAISDSAVNEAYGTKTQIYRVFDEAYKTATGKKLQIK